MLSTILVYSIKYYYELTFGNFCLQVKVEKPPWFMSSKCATL